MLNALTIMLSLLLLMTAAVLLGISMATVGKAIIGV
jgi:hypothetical protein